MFKRYYILLLLIVLSLPSFAQTAKDVIENINKTYKNAKSISQNIAYYYYDSLSAKTYSSSELGVLKKQGANTYYKVGDVELITTAAFVFQIDHGTKDAVVSPYTGNAAAQNNLDFSQQLDQLLVPCSQSTIEKPQGSFHKLILKCKSSRFSEIQIVYHKDKFYISSMVLMDRSGIKMEIKYSDVKLNDKIAPSFFDVSKYLSGDKKTYKMKEAYNSYELKNSF
jgi:outer membrane lipoprotein-sorting protein